MIFEVVQDFAIQMNRRLCENQDKGDWEECTFTFLLGEMKGHVEDLEYALLEQGRTHSIIDECADIANFAMMIVDNFGGLDGQEEAT